MTAGGFKFGNFENRKGAAKPRPLCTPLGLFLSSARDSLFLFVDLCLYASVFSALRCADVVLFLHFLCDSLPARCLYSSVLSAPRCADVVLFLHFLCGSLSARCLYSSILSALCVAISRFESQPASPRRPFTNRSSTATITSQPSSAAPMAQNLPSSHPISHNQAATLSQPHSHHPIQLQNILSINPRPLINHQRPFNLDPGIPALTGLDQHHIRLLINKRIHQLHPLRL